MKVDKKWVTECINGLKNPLLTHQTDGKTDHNIKTEKVLITNALK